MFYFKDYVYTKDKGNALTVLEQTKRHRYDALIYFLDLS